MRFGILMLVVAALGCIVSLRPLGAQPASRSVDCDAGDTIAGALPDLMPDDTLVVRGTCNEALITIPSRMTDITLEGNGTARIRNGITVLGREITIRGFDITAPASNGISVFRGGAAFIDGNTIHDAAGNGINVAQHSWAVIINNTIRNNASNGIQVIEASAARLGYYNTNRNQYGLPNIIEGNGSGIYIDLVATATIVGATIAGNGANGIRVQGGSHLAIRGATISGNQGNGIAVAGNSSVNLDWDFRPLPPNKTEPASPNQGVGISCTVGGSVSGDLGTLAGLRGPINVDRSCVDNLTR